MSDDAQEWRWVGEDGVEKSVSEHELIAELSSEALPHYTLVWKKRWVEWLPAMQVAELGWALPPGKAERAVKARESSTAMQPPPPPLYLYPVLQRRGASPGARQPADAPRPGRAAVAGLSLEEGARNGAKGETPSTLPDEVELDTITRSSPHAAGQDDEVTLVADSDVVGESGGSLDPGPGSPAFRARVYSEEDDGATHVLPSRPPPLGPVYVGPHAPPPSEAPGPTYDENEIPHIPRPPASPSDLSAYARLSPTSDVELELEPAPSPGLSTRNILLAGVAAVVGVGAAFLLLHNAGVTGGATTGEAASSERPAASLAARTSVPAALAAPKQGERPRGAPCNVVTPAVRVADWAEPLVPPVFAPIPGSGRLAVGYAQSDTYAIGMTIDPRTLDRDQVFREYRHEKLVSVVPTSGSGKLRFDIVRQGHPLTNARVVDTPTPFTLGATSFSMARIDRNGEPVPIWSFAEAEQSTLPRVVAIGQGGYAVAFRRGGKGGPVSVGYLDATGNKRGELADVRADPGSAGTPAVAADESTLLVAFALRAGQGPWSIAAATAPLGGSPRRSVKVALREGGPGGDRIAPAVGALGGGRWLVQWTEGSAGNRMARAEVLDGTLAPLTEATNLSPDGANAGQGVVWTSGDLATILFYVKNDKSNNELWGVAIDCPH